MTLKSHFISVNNVNLHYYDEGKGDPIVFLHGIPTSAYLWRNIIPKLAKLARCIAPDLVGMGQSDKPKISYRIFDHVDFFEKFIEELKLKNITLVLHGWGSVVGFEYARRHPENVKAIAFYESHITPIKSFDQLSLPVQQVASLVKNRNIAKHAVIKKNYFLKNLLPAAVVDPLSKDDLEVYEAPFKTETSRLPLWQYLLDLPLGNGPLDVVNLIQNYSDWLQKTDIPKLMLYAVPGFITTIDTVQWGKNNLKNLNLVALDDALHFAQESSPEQFADALLSWYQAINVRK